MVSRKAQTKSPKLYERRKTLGLRLLLVAFFSANLFLVLFVLRHLDSVKRQTWEISTYDELIETGLYKGRWLPDHMPESVRGLQGWTDMDSEKALVEFFIDSRDLGYLTQEFTELTPDQNPDDYSGESPDGSPRFRCFEFVDEAESEDYIRFIAFEVATSRVVYRGRPERMEW